MSDPRIRAVEENLLIQGRHAATCELFEQDPADDVLAFWSDVAFPSFNFIMGARFDDAARVEALVDAYLARGLPCLWWVTPSFAPPGVHETLLGRGFEIEEMHGMHRALVSPIEYDVLPGVTIDDVQPEEMLPTLISGFGMPAWLVDPLKVAMGVFSTDNGYHHLLASLDGEPVATGDLYITGDIGGIYNVTTIDSARGRGIGTAMTATLMELARQHGCTDVILHATEAGLPIYEKLGFETVCAVPQYVWMPPGE